LIAQWLQTFVSENPRITLQPVSSIPEAERRSIIIPVEIPNMTVIHTADLVLSKASLAKSLEPRVTFAAINEPISATLYVKWSRMWDLQTAPPRRPSQVPAPESESESLEFVYEFTAPSDAWLVAGRRKGQFRIPSKKPDPNSEPEASEFPILLFPLREGYLPYPTLDIKPVPVSKAVDEDVLGGTTQSMITCETDYKNIAETIRVVADVRSTTVSLDASGPSGGAWLIESERRGG